MQVFSNDPYYTKWIFIGVGVLCVCTAAAEQTSATKIVLKVVSFQVPI